MWYPIYRIPKGRSDIQGCFLTYHGLNHLDIADEDDGQERTETSEEEQHVKTKRRKRDNDDDDDDDDDNNNNNKNREGIVPPPASLTFRETRLQRRIEDAKERFVSVERRRFKTTTTTTKPTTTTKKPHDAVFVGQKSTFLLLRPFGLCCYKTDPEIWEESARLKSRIKRIDGRAPLLRAWKSSTLTTNSSSTTGSRSYTYKNRARFLGEDQQRPGSIS